MISKVLIVVPPLVNLDEHAASDQPEYEAYRLVSPVEPTTVAADLLTRGFEVKLFDLGTHFFKGRFEKLERALERVRPDAVVVVQSILTFATAQDWDGKRVFDLARATRPEVVTILTGNNATNYAGQAVKAGICQYSIRGEVDFAVGELLSALNASGDLSALPGLSYRAASGEVATDERYPVVDVAALPIPAYHLLEAEQKAQYATTLERAKIRFPERSAHYRDILTSRSCVLRCSFCSVAFLRGERQKYRRKPLELVMAEIESALADGIEEIHFFDDLFAQNEAQVLEFTNEIKRRRLKFHWFVGQGMPLWPLTPRALEAMVETGMYRVIAPFESGSNRVLKEVVGKVHSTVEHHHNVIQWVHELGLELLGLFVIGMPGEQRQEILETVRFAEAHPDIDYSIFSIATPMVGTRLMKRITREGRLGDEDKINRVIKRTVALYETDAFKAYEMGVIRTFDWDRINFPTLERKVKYARMVGLTLEQLDNVREHSKKTFYRFFPDYDGPLSFEALYHQPALFEEMAPVIPSSLY